MKKALVILAVACFATAAYADDYFELFAVPNTAFDFGAWDPTGQLVDPPALGGPSLPTYASDAEYPTAAPAEIDSGFYYIVATAKNQRKDMQVRGMNIIVDGPVDVIFYQYDVTSYGLGARWELSSDFGNPSTLVGGLGGDGWGWKNTNPDGASDFDGLQNGLAVNPFPPTASSLIVLGAFFPNFDEAGCVSIGIGDNGIETNAANRFVSFDGGVTNVSSNVGGGTRLSEAMYCWTPEPASFLLIGLAGLFLRRR